MAQQDVNTVTTFGNEARIDANFTELYTTTAATNAALDAASANVASALAVLIPAGLIAPYAGTSAPTGWLLCDGASLVRASYAALFTAIGTTYGAADGSHFSVPDLRARTIAGFDSGGATGRGNGVIGASVLGFASGAEAVALSIANLAAHNHTGVTGNDSPDHTHNVDIHNTNSTIIPTSATAGSLSAFQSNTVASGGASARHSHSIATEGSGTAHSNTQPTLVLNYIIKT